MQALVSLVSRLTPRLTPEDRTAGLLVCSVAIGVLLAGVLGVLLAHHVSPCNPRNLSRCGRRLASTLQGLDRLDALGHGEEGEEAEQAEAAVICPSLVEALDCFYWFSQRCLPVREQHFYAKMYVESTGLVEGLCRADPAHAREPRKDTLCSCNTDYSYTLNVRHTARPH
ncbi:uncharacterized protein LOC113201773, partial [Frankliniella occidentalis]|uniref:Uncharacterized protein LOC113201773 n=1 Tax=Frankliniella occidentalis TaxID=133901 RepID=A0A9C6XW43_FRAOC